MPAFNKWAVLDQEYVDAVGRRRKVFDPHKAQLRMMEDSARFLCCICGRRLGKSIMCGHDPLIPEAVLTKSMANHLIADGKRREFWTVGPKYSDAEKTFREFWNNCKRLGIPFDKPGSYYSPGTSSPMVVSLWGGAFIYQAKSSQDPDTLVGESISGIHVDEAAKVKEIVWTQMLSPSLSDTRGWAKFTTTPEGKNWVYDIYMDWIKPHTLNSNGHRIPSWHNPAVYPEMYNRIDIPKRNVQAEVDSYDELWDADAPGTEEWDRRVRFMTQIMEANPGATPFEINDEYKLRLSPEILQMASLNTVAVFNQEFGADFTDFVGKVFKGFDSETHCRRLEFNPDWETVACVDYGFANPNVWLLVQIGPYGEINVINELYQTNLTAEEFGNEIIRRGLIPDNCHAFYPDPALPGYTKTLETLFRLHGKNCRARAHTGGEINERLNLIRAVIKNRMVDNERSAAQWVTHPPVADKRRPQLLIDDVQCPMTVFEFSEYRYPKEKTEEAETSTKRYDTPMKKDDHTPEAFGRMMASRYFDVATQMGAGTRISHANFVRNNLGSMAQPNMGPEPTGIKHATTVQHRGGWAQGKIG